MTNRQPAGMPTGGQFAATARGRADVSLDQQIVTHTGPDGETFEFVGMPAEAAQRQAELAAQGVGLTIAPLDPKAAAREDEDVCGETYDHDIEVIDEEAGQWVCHRCGAEGWDES